MPEYQLPMGDSESHEWFDGLPAIARGYIQAAFFTGVQFWDGDGEPVEIDGLGAGNLDPEARAGMEAQAVRFWIENAETIAEAIADGGESGDYDLEAAGRDLWFSRNGHGVGFWDRGLGEIGDRLHAACEHSEINLFPYPCDPETGTPFPGFHADHSEPVYSEADKLETWQAEAGAGETRLGFAEWLAENEYRFTDPDPDPEDPDAWRVALECREPPLTDAERSALEALNRAEDGEPVSPLPQAAAAHGAPMGRVSGALEDGEPVSARRVSLDPGGYDSGGAYWGIRETGRSLWRVTGSRSGESVFIDARTRAEAINKAREAI